MSRLIVKNLASSVTKDKLKEQFSQKGVLTDVQLKFSREGKFRRFGFVGFKNEEDAQQALDYFNNSWLNGSQIRVELCAELGSANKPRAWSKYSTDSSAYKRIHRDTENKVKDDSLQVEPDKKKNSVVDEVLKKYENDPFFAEYLEARTKRTKLWSNDIKPDNEEESNTKSVEGDFVHSHCDENKIDGEGGESNDSDCDVSNNVAKTSISDTEYMKMKTKITKTTKTVGADDSQGGNEVKEKRKKKEKPIVRFYTVKLRGLKYNSKKRDIKEIFRPLKPKSIRLPVKMKGIAYVGFSTEKEMIIALKKHMSFHAGRRITVIKYTGISKYGLPEDKNIKKWEEQTTALNSEECVAESGRIFARNLAYTATENDIELLFSKFGPVTDVTMPVDRISRKLKGFAIVTFLLPEDAARAFSELDGTVFQGRMLHLLPGKGKKTIEELLAMDGLTYKQKRVLKSKAQAAITTNWNTLFLGQNAVVDCIAKNYNISKEKVLDDNSSGSLAVRLALGETELVNSTRQFLIDNGVNLSAFNQPATERSKSVLLVKNLPSGTTAVEMNDLFSKYGVLKRFILPPSGVTAIVEFVEPSEAKTAFRKLAYSKFKHLPLYLEWAPSDSFSPINSQEGSKTSFDINNVEVPKETQQFKRPNDDNDEPPEPGTTMFVSNLNSTTSSDALKEHFIACGPIHYVTVDKWKSGKQIGQSKNCAFIRFKKLQSLEKALKSYQHSVLDGCTLELKRSERIDKSDIMVRRKPTNNEREHGSIILVRNIPFQGTVQELRELFQPFGEIKSLRLPKKMAGTGSHRGFAFIEYYTKHDAERAFKALCLSTHFFGRRLVLEWAETEENIEDLRRKTARLFMKKPSHHQASKATVNFEIRGDANI